MKPFADLENKHAGETGVILTCGPSLADLDDKHIARLCDGRPVIALKHAYLRYPAKYHCVNGWRLENYTRAPGTLSFGTNWWDKTVYTDYFFPYIGYSRTMEAATRRPDGLLAVTGEWHRSLFKNALARHWGPGLMIELGIPLALWYGWSRAIVVGWDYNPRTASTFEHGIGDDLEMDDFLKWENGLVIDSSQIYWKWILSEGMRVELLSDKTQLLMPRVSYEDALP